MRAITYDRFGGPEVLRLSERPDPVPGPGQVRVDLEAASVIPADWKLRAGRLTDLFTVQFPKIPGRDGAGVVSAIGPGVDYARLGDRVCVIAQHGENGTYAQSILRDRDSLTPAPVTLAPAEAAALMHAGVCAVICIEEIARVRPRQRVLIQGGAGAIGSLAVQLAHHAGAFVAATARAENAAHLRAMGADQAIAYDREDFTRIAAPFDIVLDLIGGEVHQRSYSVLAPGGHMVCLRAAPFQDRSAEHAVRLTLAEIHDRPETLRRVVALADQRVLRPQVALRLPLERAAEAHRLMQEGRISRGRIVLDIPPRP
ncbi:NADP-dependent oxidoreductase [Pseudodonghicola flavimaris]|uniref:NADP-dependent oxidoreductase n=1 Tax=Pseudodonghicola flavimaris TaxID=3050036 RepID=A0ABT7F2C3_9RHOB|nr:NADP-dependent oxidoreductase [Pseudodonghicola flavimaris]MDK3018751.1 NADP-dependent oxidoreductase [Pseudodonghicola flavimaris]